MSEEKELFEWVKCSKELPGNVEKLHQVSRDCIIRRIDSKTLITEYFNLYGEKWGLHHFEWLKPIQSSLKEDVFNEIPDIESLIKKFLPNQFELSSFKQKEILRLEAAFQQGAQVMFHQLKNEASLTPKSIRDSDTVDIDDIEGMNSAYWTIEPRYRSIELREGFELGWKERGYKILKPNKITDSEDMVTREEYEHAINEIGQLQQQLKEAEEEIRDLNRKDQW